MIKQSRSSLEGRKASILSQIREHFEAIYLHGIKTVVPLFCPTRKPLRAFSPLFALCTNLHQEALPLQERHWKSGVLRLDGSKVIPMTNDFPNVNETRL